MVVQGMECGGAWQLQAQGHVVAYHVRPLVVTTSITVCSLVCIMSDPQRFLGLLGVTKAGPPYGAPKNERSWLLTLPQQSKLLLKKEFTLQTKQFQLRGWNDAGNMNPFFLPFSAAILKCFVPLCCSSFLSELQSSPRAGFICGYSSHCWILQWDRAGAGETILVTRPHSESKIL